MKSTFPRKLLVLPPLLWAVIMLFLTLTPADEMPRTPNWKLIAFDTAAHAGVFAVLAVLSWVALRRQRRWPALAAQAGWVVLAGCVVFGGLIEVLQYWMAVGRHAEWSDLGGDSLGAALALLAASGTGRWWQQRRLATPLLVLLLLGGSSFFAPAALAQAPAPDLGRARRTIEALAAPAMHGRGYVQGGEHLAAAYLREQLRQLGLQSLAPDYTQPFTLDVNTFPGKLAMGARYPKLGRKLAFTPPLFLTPGADFIASPNSGALTGKLRVIRLDTANLTTPAAQNEWLRNLQTPAAHRAIAISSYTQTKYPQLPTSVQQAVNSSAALVLLTPKLTASLSPEQSIQAKFEVVDNGKYWDTKPNHTGDPLLLQLQLDAELKRNYQTQNLAAIIRGKTQPDSFLVVSAHYDHLGMMGKDTYFPGANDNASGVTLLLELAAHYARPENQPAYSVVFLLFGAEEAGLVGSQYFVAHPLVPLSRIKFLVNLDLLGTGEEGATVVNGKVFMPAYQRLTGLNDAHHYLPRLTARGKAANSDHYPFSEAGVPSFFIYTRGGSQAYHDVNDRPAALSLTGFVGAFGLVRDFLDGL